MGYNLVHERDKIRIFAHEHSEKVMVNCDDAHSHSALNGCVSGDHASVMICKMNEYIEILEDALRKNARISSELVDLG